MSLPTVGFLGLGAMGGGMSKVLLKAGFQVTGFDVYRPLVDAHEAAGGSPSASPAELAKTSDILVVMVTSQYQVSEVLFGSDESAIAGLKPNAVIIVSSTVPPKYCEQARKQLDDAGRGDVFLLDCPVSGGTTRAASGDLSIFSSGPEEGLSKADPVLKALSAVLYKIPGGIGFGSKAKMCHQVLPEVEIALANELMALAARVGLNTQEVYDEVQAGDGWSWINGNRIPHMLEGDMKIYSAIPNSQKDSAIIVNESRLVTYPVILVATAEQVYQAGIFRGWAKDDDSTLWRLFLPDGPEDLVHQMTKPDCTLMSRDTTIDKQDVVNMFIGGHLATAAEAMGFTEAVGLDTGVMYDIISKAAGSNTQFVNFVPLMKKPTWSLRDVPQAKEIKRSLETSLTKANSIGAPLPMTAAALQVLNLHLV